MKKVISNERASLVFLYILWPFLALVYAVRNFKTSWAKNVLWAFVAFYGFTMVVSNNTESGSDSARYKKKFIELSNSKTTLNNFINIFYDEETQELDVIEPLVRFFVSRVTQNYHIFFTVLGVIFGFFYSRNISLIWSFTSKKINIESIILILTFSSIIGFWNLNGFRFWTAAHVYLLGIFTYFLKKNRNGILLILLSCLVHFSFLFPISIFFLYILLGNRIEWFFYFFILTSLISLTDNKTISELLQQKLPSIFQPRVKSYLGDEYTEQIASRLSNVNWYITYYWWFIKIPLFCLVTYLFLNRTAFIKSIKIKRLFCFLLILGSFGNILSLMPSGGRFLSLSYTIFIAVTMLVFQNKNNDGFFNGLLSIAVLLFLVFIVISIRISFDTISLTTLISNPIISSFISFDLSLIDIFK